MKRTLKPGPCKLCYGLHWVDPQGFAGMIGNWVKCWICFPAK